jgi:hypothetical protein
MTFTIILFAACFNWDRNWMPRKDLNYLSFSYGMAVMSAFFSIFASVAIGKYNSIIRHEYRHVPTRPALNLSRAPMKDIQMSRAPTKDIHVSRAPTKDIQI